MEAVVIAVGMMLSILSVIALGVAQGRKSDAAWAALADRLGLQPFAGRGNPARRLAGHVRGYRVSVDTVVHGAGKSRTVYTRYRLTFPRPLALGIRMRREGLGSVLGQMVGIQDVRTGDSTFDRTVLVKGADHRRVIAFLTPARREALQRLIQTAPMTTIDDNGIEILTHGVAAEAQRMEFHLDQMASLVPHLLDVPDERVPDADVRPVRPEQVPPAPGAALAPAAARAASAPGPAPTPPARTPVPAAPVTATEPSAPVTARASAAPVPAPSAPASSPSSAPPQPTALSAPARPASSEPAPPLSADLSGGPLAAAAVCAALFGPGTSSLDAGSVFDKSFRGQVVRWAAPLVDVDAPSFDVHLGSGPFTRATFALHEVAGGLLGGGTVRGVVRLPADVGTDLRRRIGQRVAFEGRLVACDAFGRVLFLADGRLLESGGEGGSGV